MRARSRARRRRLRSRNDELHQVFIRVLRSAHACAGPICPLTLSRCLSAHLSTPWRLQPGRAGANKLTSAIKKKQHNIHCVYISHKSRSSCFLHPPHLQSPTPPQYVFWQKNERMINYDDSRQDISIDTTPAPRTQSRLIIREPQISDSGNYTCSASNTEPASIFVFVSKGECDLCVYAFRTRSLGRGGFTALGNVISQHIHLKSNAWHFGQIA